MILVEIVNDMPPLHPFSVVIGILIGMVATLYLIGPHGRSRRD